MDYIDPKRGFEPYMLTFMFKLSQLQGVANEHKNHSMRHEIERVYSRFLTECVRYPWSERNKNSRPILIACQDWPVPKPGKQAKKINRMPWEGAHWGSILLLPPRNRLKRGVKDHFEIHRRDSYVRPGSLLSRIHVEHITYNPEIAVAYTFKSLARRRCGSDDLLILPVSRAERSEQSRGKARSEIA